MRRLVNLALLLSGCQLLPAKDLQCTETDRCAQSVTAPFVLGQPDGKTNWLMNGLGKVSGLVLLAGGKLMVSDSSNNRVLIWNTFPTRFNQPPDQWIGEPDLSVVSYSVPESQVVSTPTRMASDGTHLVIASDATYGGASRPLTFWNTFPTKSYPPYDFQINPGSYPTAGPHTMDGASPLYANGRLYASDRGFHRMLIWTTLPTGAKSDASLVLGQPSLTTSTANNGGVGASSLNGPEGSPASDGTVLFVPDTLNNRVLGFNALPTASNAAADLVLGQTGFVSNQVNAGGTSLGTLNGPSSAAIGGTRLAVADRGNHRVLLWNTLPTASGQLANVVVGQPNGVSTVYNYGGLQAASLYGPAAVATDGTRLVVADSNNYRVLIWNSWPTAPATPADIVLGQPDMTSGGYLSQSASAKRLLRPNSITRAGSLFIVADSDANRVLIWPQLPVDSAAQPTIVLGQPDLTSSGVSTSAISAGTLYAPASVSSDGKVLAVADANNHRVLLWNSIPTQNRQPADIVLGQPSTTTATTNNGGVALGLNNPNCVHVADGRLYVADSNNHRVLIWKTLPTQNQQPADLVLGQNDFTGGMRNHGNADPDATTLDGPRGVYADEGHIYVSDPGNDRLLIWNTVDPANGQAADVVVGATDFTSSGRLSTPASIQVFRGRLYLAEAGANRVAVWNSIPTQNGLPVAYVLGQSNLQANGPNTGGLGPTVLQRPTGLLVTDIGIYVADNGNGRIVAFPQLP